MTNEELIEYLRITPNRLIEIYIEGSWMKEIQGFTKILKKYNYTEEEFLKHYNNYCDERK